ncbi:MAG TPA: amino acid adenylation domain-containing protein, partial [Herpetosiphonaceae bacterium]
MTIKKDIESFYPLSPMQQGMLFHTLYDDGSGMYVEQLIIPVQSTLNVAAFQRAWEQVAQRHSIFRSTFVWEGIKTPVQVVHRRVDLPWELADWRDLSADEQQARLKAFLDADRQRGFDLAHAPLMRLALFRVADDTYQFVWSQHHMLMDGWSLPLVLNEVFVLYEAALQGREAPLPRPRPYRDYITWLQQQDLAQAERFWRQFLAGFTSPTPLGVDRALGPDAGPGDYREVERLLPIERATTLQALARQHGLTMNTVMQGAWAILLSHYSGEPDVVFGATVSGRPAELPGVESMIGLFINTLPVRIQIRPEMTLLDWLKQVQAQQAELRQYEYSPLVQIQGWSDVPRGQPLFESLLVFENYPATAAGRGSDTGNGARPSLAFGKMQAVERTNYPLNLMAGMGAMRLNYDRQRFDDATIERMLGHLEIVLAQIAAQPQQRLADLVLLTPEERQQQHDWNTTAAPYPADACLHQLVAAQAARTPDRDAVVFGGERLSYAELNSRANQLAHTLQARGVGPDVRVGLCVERSIDAMVGVLGILKAGGACTPLDPAYPRERLAFMLADARVPILLTQQHLQEHLHPEGTRHQTQVICLDADWPTIAQSPTESPGSPVTPDHLACVIYTSGSTGQPKGVGMPHRPLVNLLDWQQTTIPGARRTLQFAPLSFDVSYQEIFSTWSTGGTLVLISEELRRDTLALLDELDSAAVERLFVPFVALQHLAEQAQEAKGLRHMREIITAGEQLQITPALARWLATTPECTLHNHYGPTESHVVTAWTLTGAPTAWPPLPPIGTPIANARIWLLNSAGQPVPVGVVGEIYIGGTALARGYLDRPDLTAERFVPDPFGPTPGGRLYRTGDLGRYQENGAIDYVGRRDQQVKVRGYRIEVGEIEAVLAQHPAVREAIVVAREESGHKRLVGYVVENQEREPCPEGTPRLGSSQELRQFLGQRLPDYMVPSAFVFLDALPLTPSGKVNRRALPAPDQLRPDLGDAYVAPRTPIEEMLAQIWAEVLHVERVGVHDSFFELGGHSLMATQVISRIREVCQVDLPLRALFEAPTVAGLSERIASARFEAPELIAPPIQPVPRDGTPLVLSFAQQRLWFFDQLQPESAAYNISTALHFEGTLDVAALEQSLSEIVRRHESLRTVFAQGGDLGQPIQLIGPVEPLPLPQIGLDFLPPEERLGEAIQMASEEAERPFDLQSGPLLRATLLHLGPTEHVLLLNMHHIVSDGWSMGVFMREMTVLYRAFATGSPSPLPELPIQYADYAAWQRNWLQGDVLSAQLDYWKQQLGPEGTPVPTLQMPTDYPRPPVATLRGAVQEFALPQALGETLKAISRREGATLFMTLLTAWQVLLSRYSGQDDIAVGTPIANRTRGEVERLIGYFINTLVLRTDLTGATTFREALQRVRATALGAYAHQDLPFEQIVDAVQPERDLSRHAIFQVMFVLQNAPMDPVEMPGLLFKPLAIARTTTRFDLTLTMAEGPHGLTGALEYSTDLFEPETITRLIGHFQTLLTEIAAQPAQPLASLSLLTPGEEHQVLIDWNATAREYPHDACIHTLFAEQAARTPDAIAAVFEDQQIAYAELDRRSNQLARYLQSLGVGPDVCVGVFMERSLDLVVGLLGILKAGGAYLPLDPSYPADRLSFMVADSAAPVLLTQRNLLLDLPDHQAQVVCVDTDWPTIARSSAAPVASAATPDHLAYVIYTSGSTGRPKGVMVPHRGVVNFFVGIDERIGEPQPGTWLAVTSISFDISVLELFWTLTRGFQVVVQREADYSQAQSSAHADKPMQFSLFYFASDDRADTRTQYRLLMEGAKFADRHGFTAVWTPERHFHAFGGLYPNPSVTSAAIAAITERVQIRAGSVVLPLHNPIRVAEEWSVVDNLSNGRVGISFASGWHADDFVFAPERFTTRKQAMLEQIETVRKLWRGEAVPFKGGAGNQVDIRVSPRPVQADLPMWLTASGAPETFKTAGALGVGVLTHLLGQTVEGLAEKIALYRAAWREHGHPGDGHVTLMLHTFVGKDLDVVRETVREPFTNYLRTSLDLIGNLARSMGRDPQAEDFSEDDMTALLDHAFDRYFETSSLMGTPDICLQMVDRLKGIGVDEVACLIDFGVEVQTVIDSFDYLMLLQERSNRYARATADYSVLAQLSRHGISHMQCTPSMANMLLLDPEALTAMASLRKLMLGGEALPLALADQLTRALDAELHNMYGPTETTIWSTTQQVERGSTAISIGRPIANTEIYILDRYLQPTAIGIPGDLYIGGDGLVRGYLNRPELTAERFIPNPFGGRPHGAPGTRLYKTGDLARYRANGTIEYLGRVDTQVKIRGYRIEVGEIEAVLGEHPAVREAVVVARDDATSADSSAKRLVAYVVPHETMPAMNELRSFLEARLPGYMVPALIMALDALPLTPNGKVDRSALPAPDQLRPDLETDFVAPQTPIEQMLANIWADVLQVGEVGVTDNFFSLGGNSLLATLLVSRMREAFQVDLPVRMLFEAPTIAGLSQRIVQARTSDSSLLPPPIRPVPRDGALPLSFAQQRLWFINRLQPDNPAYNEPTAIRVSGPFDFAAMEHTINTIIRRHEALRTTFTIQNGEPVQIIAAPQPQPLPLIDLQGIPEAEREAEARRVAREEAHRLFDLERGPLFRVTLLRISPEDHVILLMLHHIISDGWSNSVIIQELKTLYNAEVKGEPVTLPDLPVQYADYAVWQRDWLQGEVVEAHLSYWRQQLADVPPLHLPIDHPRPPIASFEGAVEHFVLSQPLRQALNTISRREGVTLFMTMLAAFQTLLARYTGQDDVAVGTPTAGRNMRETEGMIGFFINTLVLRTDLSGNPSFRETLQRVREVALGAYTHQDLPFEQIVDAVQPERDMSRQPLFQAMFALQNAPAAALELQDLTISPIPIEHTSTKFDLDLSLIETEQGMVGSLHYSTDLFEATTIRRMLAHFTTLLEGIAANPDHRLAALPLVTESERQQL